MDRRITDIFCIRLEIVKGRSGRGNVTTDTFSLLGFSAAVEEAEKRCQS